MTTTDETSETEKGIQPWQWIVGIVAAAAILALIFGDSSSRDRYLFSRHVTEPEVTEVESTILGDVLANVEDAAAAAREDLAGEAAAVREDLEDVVAELRAAAQGRGKEAAAHLDAGITWLDESIDDVENAAEDATNDAVQSGLERLQDRLTDARDRLERASAALSGAN